MVAHTMNSAFDILSTLPAPGPHEDIRDKLMLFGRFVGVWDMDVTFLDEKGNTVLQGPGKWEFGWILDGRAMQDVLTFADKSESLEPGKRRIGTSVRGYNPEMDRWRVVWLGATSGNFVILEGGPDGDDIRIEGSGTGGGPTRVRWVFTDISDDRFHWLGYISNDGGETWRVEQDMHARRRK